VTSEFFISLIMRTETVLETLVHLLFNHLVCLPAWESFYEFSHWKLQII